MTAAKFWDDYFLSNQNYSLIGGINVEEINMLESEFLILISYNLYIDGCTYSSYLDKLSGAMSKLINHNEV